MGQRNALMGEEHIRLVRKFYSIPDLPQDVLRVKNEAYSSAYYHAGVMCENKLTRKIRYFMTAVKYSPYKYLSEYRVRLLIMFTYALMCIKPFGSPLERLKKRYQKIRSKFTPVIAP